MAFLIRFNAELPSLPASEDALEEARNAVVQMVQNQVATLSGDARVAWLQAGGHIKFSKTTSAA